MEQTQEMLAELTQKSDKLINMLMEMKEQTVNEINGYISEDDAVKLLGKSKIWFWRQRKEGVLGYKKLGARIYYSKEKLFNLFENFE